MVLFEMWTPGLSSDRTVELFMLIRWKNHVPQRWRRGDEVATMHSVGTSLSHAPRYLPLYRTAALIVGLAYLMLFDKTAAGILFTANAKSKCA